ncbi:MAG TPA: hypothetical protein VFU63_06075 [Ktedonobacterales bacterium]|nr:hypothetical protein [Ktedonobacterales bacterium]
MPKRCIHAAAERLHYRPCSVKKLETAGNEPVLRLVGALLMEHDETWTTGKRYLNMTAYIRKPSLAS